MVVQAWKSYCPHRSNQQVKLVFNVLIMRRRN